MNIVLLPSPPFEEIGGVSTHVYMLAKGLREMGNHVFVIPVTPPKLVRAPLITLPALLLKPFSRYYSIRYEQGANNLYYAMDALWKTKFKIDVLNVQNVQHVGIVGCLRSLVGCKAVLTVHGYLTYEAEENGLCKIGDKFQTWLWSMEIEGYQKFDSIVCVGRAVERYMEKFVVKSVQLIHNGLDTDYFYPIDKSTEPKKTSTILFAGVLQDNKGVLDALQVIQKLVKEFLLEAVLIIAGSGPQEPLARQYVVDYGLTDCVIFLGSVSKEKMPDFYRSGDIFLCPSRQRGVSGKGEEPFGYTALEAMACGTPVVAYRTGGLKEQMQDGVTGYLVEPGDVAELANCVRTLIEHPEQQDKMAVAARTHCVQNFSHIKMAQQFLDVYHSRMGRTSS